MREPGLVPKRSAAGSRPARRMGNHARALSGQIPARLERAAQSERTGSPVEALDPGSLGEWATTPARSAVKYPREQEGRCAAPFTSGLPVATARGPGRSGSPRRSRMCLRRLGWLLPVRAAEAVVRAPRRRLTSTWQSRVCPTTVPTPSHPTVVIASIRLRRSHFTAAGAHLPCRRQGTQPLTAALAVGRSRGGASRRCGRAHDTAQAS